MLLGPGLEVAVLLLKECRPRLTFLILHQLDLLLLEARDLFLQLGDILLGPTALLLKLLAVLSQLALLVLQLRLDLTRIEQALEALGPLFEVHVLLVHHVFVELELLDLVRQLSVDVL